MAANQTELVYGGAKVGLMGGVADAVMNGGGRVLGVIPEFLKSKELAHEGLTELIVVDSMHERKQIMYDRCDAFLVLPGGFGTLDELFEMLTWNQLGNRPKAIGIWNIEGFYDPLVTQMNPHGRSRISQ